MAYLGIIKLMSRTQDLINSMFSIVKETCDSFNDQFFISFCKYMREKGIQYNHNFAIIEHNLSTIYNYDEEYKEIIFKR